MSQFHVNQIATFVRDAYGEGWSDELDDTANLSRLLGLYSVSLVLRESLDDGSRLIEVTDGSEDRGIDALGVDPASRLVVFVQSKWRQDGTGSMSLAEVLKFVDGVRSLLGMQGDGGGGGGVTTGGMAGTAGGNGDGDAGGGARPL